MAGCLVGQRLLWAGALGAGGEGGREARVGGWYWEGNHLESRGFTDLL